MKKFSPGNCISFNFSDSGPIPLSIFVHPCQAIFSLVRITRKIYQVDGMFTQGIFFSGRQWFVTYNFKKYNFQKLHSYFTELFKIFSSLLNIHTDAYLDSSSLWSIYFCSLPLNLATRSQDLFPVELKSFDFHQGLAVTEDGGPKNGPESWVSVRASVFVVSYVVLVQKVCLTWLSPREFQNEAGNTDQICSLSHLYGFGPLLRRTGTGSVSSQRTLDFSSSGSHGQSEPVITDSDQAHCLNTLACSPLPAPSWVSLVT